ncbi:2-oxoacid:ferredoxin oxidoreductase subunit beta [Balneolaceae bacterium YR4-1]|uniref:2-oxoacid:ferredoxin oxidoreductase subunit beta n=1 Tax=Halalkalibaculum roseum TaxID=2709311 RepID=A0A6M1SRZ3_9BACT|nr:2-oxoacid:ferredoxin oxidoreductase subunit beta [Halalkalibaculum roseum]NGP77849.1 2-oxoacid:ferredoxin oxidoreductase subunit beta [Halalkalibaculum roseum]
MKTETKTNGETLTVNDFKSDRNVKWCPGCGDYMILAMMQKTFTQLDHKKEDIVCISGIGCSSRLPYYLETFGIHSLHGRAPAVSTGLKLANPDLSVWVVTGDGDSMAIGGNHFIHACRRNLDLNIIIFNNKIYGMTKGQSSPTTPLGTKTKTAPYGSYEPPFTIGELAISAGATFFARVPDKSPNMLGDVMMEAYKHKGTSVIEVLQNCVIFTDGIHEQLTGKDTKDENQLVLEQGKPMIFGKDQEFGIAMDGMKLKKVSLDDDSDHEPLVHDPTEMETQMHIALSRLQLPDYPVAMGIIRNTESVSFDETLHHIIEDSQEKSPYKNVTELFHTGNTWNVS